MYELVASRSWLVDPASRDLLDQRVFSDLSSVDPELCRLRMELGADDEAHGLGRSLHFIARTSHERSVRTVAAAANGSRACGSRSGLPHRRRRDYVWRAGGRTMKLVTTRTALVLAVAASAPRALADAPAASDPRITFE